MKGALDIHRELLARDYPHEIVRLPRLVLHADEIPDALGLWPGQCVRVQVFLADGQLVALAAPAGSPATAADVAAATGTSLARPAVAEQVNAATDYAAGLVSPLLLPASVTLLIDSALLQHDVLYCATGDSGTALGIRTSDLLTITGARIIELTPAVVPAIALG